MASRSLNERQKRILEMTERSGFVTIEQLAQDFAVSAQTIRRDIILLSDLGYLQRFHGGAGVSSEPDSLRLDHHHKAGVSVEAKRKVALAAAMRIPEKASLFLDVGTTIEMTAAVLNRRGGFRIFTTSMHAALAFDPACHEINVLGGRVAGKDGSLVGEDVMVTLDGLRVDYSLIACSGIETSGRVMDFNLSKVAVKKAAMAAAHRRFLLATPSKFGRTALAMIGHRRDFDLIVDGTAVCDALPERGQSQGPGDFL